MIGFVRGNLVEKGSDHVIVDNQGIGYLIYTPESVLNELPPIGNIVKIHTFMYVR